MQHHRKTQPGKFRLLCTSHWVEPRDSCLVHAERFSCSAKASRRGLSEVVQQSLNNQISPGFRCIFHSCIEGGVSHDVDQRCLCMYCCMTIKRAHKEGSNGFIFVALSEMAGAVRRCPICKSTRHKLRYSEIRGSRNDGTAIRFAKLRLVKP
jgi:hypothetical protein